MSRVDRPRPGGGRRSRVRRAALIQGILLGLLVLLAVAPSASAARYWCRSDPLFAIDGNLVDVFVSVPPEVLLRVSGPTQVVLTLPEGVDASVVLAGIGFGRGEQVTIAHSRRLRVTGGGIQLWVDVLVPASGAASQMLIEFAPHPWGLLSPTLQYGQTNNWTRLATTL